LQTGELDVQLQLAIGLMTISLMHLALGPLLFTSTVSLIVPDEPAVKVID
jgi:hypothetical protein